MIGTYHEDAPVGKRFESGQFPHRCPALDAKNHTLILPKSTATNQPPANHKPVTPAQAEVHILRTFEIMDSRLQPLAEVYPEHLQGNRRAGMTGVSALPTYKSTPPRSG